jgi:16S rRNA (cytosine967-C5)-methyltransferase
VEASHDARDGSGRIPERTAPRGLASRRLAVELVTAVLSRGRALDDALAEAFGREEYRELSPPDRGLARLIASTVLRRLGQLEALLAAFIERPLPKDSGRLTAILLAAAAQLAFLSLPPHAVINIAVEQCRRERRAARFAGLANAVLRRIAEQAGAILVRQDAVRMNIPEWLWSRWTKAYGEETTRRIAEASLREAPLDLTVRSDPAEWAARLGGLLLPTGSVRLKAGGRIEDLPGFEQGAWWVQDAAAALPARLLGPLEGLSVADLCAAPGGKTAELAAAGARVTAVDSDGRRLERLRSNLARLHLDADLVAADAAAWKPERPFDAVLLDAPCLSTGTIRRHPDILRLKREADLGRLVEVQARLLDNALGMVRPGGKLVYCVCSLEPEEGAEQAARVLQEDRRWARQPIRPEEIGADATWITPEGDLRTLPFHMRLESDDLSGMDGFYATRLIRQK